MATGALLASVSHHSYGKALLRGVGIHSAAPGSIENLGDLLWLCIVGWFSALWSQATLGLGPPNHANLTHVPRAVCQADSDVRLELSHCLSEEPLTSIYQLSPRHAACGHAYHFIVLGYRCQYCSSVPLCSQRCVLQRTQQRRPRACQLITVPR